MAKLIFPAGHVFLKSDAIYNRLLTANNSIDGSLITNIFYNKTIDNFNSSNLINTTTSLCTSLVDHQSQNSLIIFSMIFMVIVNLVVIFGNLLVIISVFLYSKLRTVTNFFIVSLAVADLLLGLTVLPYSLTQTISKTWYFGEIWCLGWLVIDVWLSTASILNLVAISVDRYLAITQPLKYRTLMTAKRAKTIIASAWILSFLICFPPLVGWNQQGSGLIKVNLTKTLEYKPQIHPSFFSSSLSFETLTKHLTSKSLNSIENLKISIESPKSNSIHKTKTLFKDKSKRIKKRFIRHIGKLEKNKLKNFRFSRSIDSMSLNKTSIDDNCENYEVLQCILFDSKGYVIYSAFGSFFIPMFIMVFFYWRIYLVAMYTTQALNRGYISKKCVRTNLVSGFPNYQSEILNQKDNLTNNTEKVYTNKNLTLRVHRGFVKDNHLLESTQSNLTISNGSCNIKNYNRSSYDSGERQNSTSPTITIRKNNSIDASSAAQFCKKILPSRLSNRLLTSLEKNDDKRLKKIQHRSIRCLDRTQNIVSLAVNVSKNKNIVLKKTRSEQFIADDNLKKNQNKIDTNLDELNLSILNKTDNPEIKNNVNKNLINKEEDKLSLKESTFICFNEINSNLLNSKIEDNIKINNSDWKIKFVKKKLYKKSNTFTLSNSDSEKSFCKLENSIKPISLSSGNLNVKDYNLPKKSLIGELSNKTKIINFNLTEPEKIFYQNKIQLKIDSPKNDSSIEMNKISEDSSLKNDSFTKCNDNYEAIEVLNNKSKIENDSNFDTEITTKKDYLENENVTETMNNGSFDSINKPIFQDNDLTKFHENNLTPSSNKKTKNIVNFTSRLFKRQANNFKTQNNSGKFQAKRYLAETKAAKTVGVIVGGFICCWFPFFTVYLVRGLCEDKNCVPEVLLTIFTWLGYINSALNPIIYGMFSKDFRKAFKNIICKCKFTEETGVTSLIRQIHLPNLFEEDMI
uniref:G protein-coupled receptor n=1 Tax=Polyphagotarsonemus latus TaxID=1204166 RepID=A0AAN0LHF2_9ACAR